ncbi:MAG: hypothetical protein GY713_19455 [Actinomycetia bacterium]|nr:hypothetical protein [Actinomycetes bacterium]
MDARVIRHPRVTEIENLPSLIARDGDLAGTVVQSVTIPAGRVDWAAARLDGLVLLGCTFEDSAEEQEARQRGALAFPPLPSKPYSPYRTGLYTPAELLADRGDGLSVDEGIYRHFEGSGRHQSDLIEALAQRIHDHAIDDALGDLLDRWENPPVVGIMGGHSTLRTEPAYADAARTAWLLGQAGYTVATGGGPGTMEAANLGAWLASVADPAVLDEALAVLAPAPHYSSAGHQDAAERVRSRFPVGAESVAIPTWFYGHEPSNLFASHVAKYFANSIREDRLLAVADAGVVFTPGSAGTAQEVFQNAAQNHYETLGRTAPMVFVGRDHWERRTHIVPAIRAQAEGRPYAELITCVDDPADAVAFIAERA